MRISKIFKNFLVYLLVYLKKMVLKFYLSIRGVEILTDLPASKILIFFNIDFFEL